jgi:hypothetical protein
MGVHEKMTGAERVAKRRASLRARGLKLRQFWVPDMGNSNVRAELSREAKEINRLDAASDDMEFLESIRAEVWGSEPDYDWGPDGPPDGTQQKASRPE